MAEYRAGDEVAEHQRADDDRGGKGHALPGKARPAARFAEQRQRGEHGNHRQVLEQQNGESRLPALRTERAALVQGLQRERGRGERQRHPGDQRDAHVDAQEQRDAGDQRDRAQHLRQSQRDEPRAHVPQPVRLELEADDEEQEHHAELGEGADRLRLADQLKAPRSDGDSSEQISRHRAQAEAMRRHHRHHGGCEIDRGLQQESVAMLH